MSETVPPPEDVKKMFLSGGKGKYEFLKFIFNSQELQSEKPFVLAALAVNRLDLDTSDFNNKSFRQWLKRHREKTKSKKPAFTPTASGSAAVAIKKQEGGEKFQFTDPSTLPREE